MRKVLVVEDSSLFRKKIDQILTKAGYQVVLAKNGYEGLKIHTLSPCDLIVTDLVMPDMEGIEFILKVKKHFNNTRIIAISGANPLYLRTAIKIGADYKLQKPFTREELLNAVDQVSSMVDNSH